MDCEYPDYRTPRIFDKILKICPDCGTAAEISAGNQKGIICA